MYSSNYTLFKKMNKNKSIIASFLIVIFLFAITACSADLNYTPISKTPVKEVSLGQIKTDGLVIKAENGSFVLEKGNFTPPFQIDTYNAKMGLWNYDNIKDESKEALEMGAEKVRVKVPGYDEEFYGVLALSKVDAARAEGPASKSYLLQVPDTYASNALGGRTSVIYEPHSLGNNNTWFSWILWISDVPFNDVSPMYLNMTRAEKEEMAVKSNIERINSERFTKAQAIQEANSVDGGEVVLDVLLYSTLIFGTIYLIIYLAEQE
jgi:hypothetical protein